MRGAACLPTEGDNRRRDALSAWERARGVLWDCDEARFVYEGAAYACRRPAAASPSALLRARRQPKADLEGGRSEFYRGRPGAPHAHAQAQATPRSRSGGSGR